jgi:F-type H+-transporting ATPase subunit epsilon
MADTMKFDLVSPERRLASGEARSVQIPGAEGQLTAMPDHAPVITTLRPGILRVEMVDGIKEFAVTGGFAEITPEGASVLAERAYVRGTENRAEIEAQLDEARKKAAEAPAEERDMAELLVSDLVDLIRDMASDRSLQGSGAPAPA